jgi:methylated-DNA-[protein]-cysteine S-methyltransferase
MTDSLRLLVDHLDTPLGRFAVVADEDHRLRAAGFTSGHARMEKQLRLGTKGRPLEMVPASDPGGLTTAITRYFAGDVHAIDDLPVVFDGTSFQCAVWEALRLIPVGETWSYARLAQHVGNPRAVRAVGLANGANPVAVVVPCHRVIGSDGGLTGYGGGIERKRWLLQHEGTPGKQAGQTVLSHAWALCPT